MTYILLPQKGFNIVDKINNVHMKIDVKNVLLWTS
jgi:hypothetical protein